jgi:hypothetical protein
MENKILFCVLHGSCYRQRAQNILNTWGKSIDIIFYADYEDEKNKVIKVSERTDYFSNEEKHVNVFKFLVNNNYNFEWYFFCDDDTFVNVKNLYKFLENCDQNSLHGEILMGTYPIDKTLNYCSGGAGYLIHKNIFTPIAENIHKHRSHSHSDVTLGLVCRELNIAAQDSSNLFHSQTPEHYQLDDSAIVDSITFHYVRSIEKIKRFLYYLNI